MLGRSTPYHYFLRDVVDAGKSAADRPDATTRTSSASEFRGAWRADAPDVNGPRRHMFDAEMVARIAEYTSGPRLSDATISRMRHKMTSGHNVHRHSGPYANAVDHDAAVKVMAAYHIDSTASLSAHEASHIRDGAYWLADHASAFPTGFLNTAMAFYANVEGPDGARVVNVREFWRRRDAA
jgi:hypothetical protein